MADFPQVPFRQLRQTGWILALFGALSVICPAVATIAVERLVAFLLILSGVTGVLIWRSVNSSVVLAIAVMAFTLGMIFVFNPGLGAETLTIALAMVLIIEGIGTILFAYFLRASFSGWFWVFLSGSIAIMMGLLVFTGWPGTATWILGLLFGINLLTSGLSLLALGYSTDTRK